MADILQSWKVCDGWNVEVVIAGHRMVLHFLAEPTEQEQADTIASVESRLKTEEAEAEEILEIVE